MVQQIQQGAFEAIKTFGCDKHSDYYIQAHQRQRQRTENYSSEIHFRFFQSFFSTFKKWVSPESL
jgi:hypothetical protein